MDFKQKNVSNQFGIFPRRLCVLSQSKKKNKIGYVKPPDVTGLVSAGARPV